MRKIKLTKEEMIKLDNARLVLEEVQELTLQHIPLGEFDKKVIKKCYDARREIEFLIMNLYYN